MKDLDVADAIDMPWQPLLYQSGYLTIKELVQKKDENGEIHPIPDLKLGIPNQEVRETLSSLYWKTLFGRDTDDFTSLLDTAKQRLVNGDIRSLVGMSLYSVYAKIPSTWRIKCEADAKRHFMLFMQMLGARPQPEEASVFGYADAIIETKDNVYVFEFKYNKSAKAAIRQIREKGYADEFKGDSRPVTLIGINFRTSKRNIDEPVFEALSTNYAN